MDSTKNVIHRIDHLGSLYTVDAVAKKLRITKDSLYARLRRKGIALYKIGNVVLLDVSRVVGDADLNYAADSRVGRQYHEKEEN